METLKLDEATHQYTLDGKPVDGLTSTIKEAGLIRNSDPFYADRGTKIHLATQYWDERVLDEETVDPQIQGYLESWKRFRKDQNYTPVEIEYPIYNPELKIASKIDRIPLLDIKGGIPEPWHILQIAFQWETLKSHHDWRLSHYGDYLWEPKDIYLDPKGGPPKVKTYTYSELREGFRIYSSMLYFIRWRREKYGSTTSNYQP